MSLRKISAIAKVTTKEFTQPQIVIAITCVWLSIMLASLAFATVSIGQRIFVLSDFGLFLADISTVLLIVIGGSNLLAKEIKRKSIYTVLSKPVGRITYLLGKFWGLLAASIILNIILHLLLVIFIFIFENKFVWSLLVNIWYVALQSSILSSVCLLASSIMVTPALVGIATSAAFVAGRNISVLSGILKQNSLDTPAYKLILITESILPSLSSINVADALTYQQLPSLMHALNSLLYAISYTAMILALTILALCKREFN